MFKLSIDEDYYKPTFVKSGYNNNYIQYESKGDKILTVKEYLSLIEPYLADMINDPAHFLSLPGLAWRACLKKTNVKLELLNDYDMLY